ncbi:MAG TPA: TAXI family TRAP transporter solute-binding subunit, partial [Burkholderiales bacterium]|nr:TAXI family TRAP transporter solute-binding subunit [Burkholderiales bacterium]
MPRLVRAALVSLRDLAATAGPFLLVALGLLIAAYFVLDPAPPRRVVLATGPEGTAYAEFGKRYAAELARYGIEVALRPSMGARDNLRLLREAKEDVDLGFVQGGAGEEEAAPSVELVSLGSVNYEPVWIFRRGQPLQRLGDLRGLRVNTGVRGSGTPGITRRLLEANFVERDELKRESLAETPAVMALLEGKLDAAVLVSPPESPMVQMLLQTPGLHLYEYAHAEAYSRRFPYLVPVVLPRGVVDLSRDVPREDITLIATTTALVSRADTHPALMQLFVQAAARIHGGPGWIARAGEFPNARAGELPLAKEAQRYYQSGGPPLLQRYLPFWLANLVDRMWVALFSIIAVLIPLSRLLPPLYEFRVRSR